LYFNGNQKLTTTSTGIDVTGSVTCDGFTSTGIDDNATSTAITIDASETVSLVSNLEFAGVAGSDRWIITDETDTGTGVVKMQAGFGSGAAGGGLNLYAHSHATKPGDVVAGISSGSGGSFRVNTTGIDGGTNLIQVDADGLKFNGDTAAANALDDYETGTWTPTWTDGTNADATYSTSVGTYTKIGNKVLVKCYVIITALGTMSGSLRMQGLPFTSSATTANYSTAHFGYGVNLAITAGTNPSGYVEVGANYIVCKKWDSTTGVSSFTTSNLSANGQVMISASYTV